MLTGIFSYFTSSSQQQEDAPADVAERISVDVNEEVVEGGEWVSVDRQRRSSDTFHVIKAPRIVALDDDGFVEVSTRNDRSPSPEAIKRREQLTTARAKTASRKHLESVMFADPVSGKDVRFFKPANSQLARSSTSNAVRRVNAPTGTQRSKKTSGKSNDRKVHRAIDIFVFPDV